MTRAGRTRQAQRLFAPLPRTYERVAAALSFGQDARWRSFMVSRVPRAAERVLDVATGTGLVAREVVRRMGAGVVGLDQSEPMLREGVRRVHRDGLAGRIRFVLGRAEQLPFADGSFDAVTFTYLLRYVDDPSATLCELGRAVRPGGVVANLEFHVPPSAFWRALWRAYTRAVMPLAGRLLSRGWYDVGRFLGRSIEDLYRRLPLERQLELWRDAGIRDVRARVMSLGGGVVIWGTKQRGTADGE